MSVTLFGDRILIIPDALEEKTKGGLFIPDTAKDSQKKVMATVYAHGIGFMDQNTGVLQPIKVKNGDRISLSKEIAFEMPLGEDITGVKGILYLINESDIDCILDMRVQTERYYSEPFECNPTDEELSQEEIKDFEKLGLDKNDKEDIGFYRQKTHSI